MTPESGQLEGYSTPNLKNIVWATCINRGDLTISAGYYPNENGFVDRFVIGWQKGRRERSYYLFKPEAFVDSIYGLAIMTSLEQKHAELEKDIGRGYGNIDDLRRIFRSHAEKQ